MHPNNKVRGANMGPIWGQQDPGGPHVGPMNLAIWAWTGLTQIGYANKKELRLRLWNITVPNTYIKICLRVKIIWKENWYANLSNI